MDYIFPLFHLSVTIKGKPVSVSYVETYGEMKMQFHPFLPLASDAVSGKLHAQTALPLPRKKCPRHPVNRRQDGPQNWLDALEKKEILPLPAIKPRFFGRPARRLDTVPTALDWWNGNWLDGT
jgi:hypothetical protein